MSAISEGDNSNAVDCRSCCAAVPVGRRYCPSCGTRQGEPRVEPGPVLAALAGASMAAQASGGAPPIDAVSAGAAEPRPEGGLLAGVASRSAALTGMALLMLGVVAGAAFSPPVGNSDASAQRVIIVKAPAAVATGPAAQPPVSPVGSDPGVYPGGTVGSTPTGTGSGYAYAPYDQGTSSGSDTGSGSGSGSTTDPTKPTKTPTIGHIAVVMLPGGAPGQSFVQSSARHSQTEANAASSQSFSSVSAWLAAKGTVIPHFKQDSDSGFANRIALMTGSQPTSDMTSGCADMPIRLASAGGCFVDRVSGRKDLFDLATASAITPREAFGVYVDVGKSTIDKKSNMDLCTPVKAGATVSSSSAVLDNPLLWLESSSNDEGTSSLCSDESLGVVRSAVSLEGDLRNAWAVDSENFDPTVSSAFPKVSMLLPSHSSTSPEDLRKFLESYVVPLSRSSIFKKDGAVVVVWDRPSSSGRPTGTVVLSPFAKAGAQSERHYTTYGLMRTMQAVLGMKKSELIGSSSKAARFGEDVFPRR